MGIILFKLLFAEYPYQGNTKQELIQNINSTLIKFPPLIPVSNEVKDLIQNLLNPQIEKRILSTFSVITHSWLRSDIENTERNEIRIINESISSSNLVEKEKEANNDTNINSEKSSLKENILVDYQKNTHYDLMIKEEVSNIKINSDISMFSANRNSKGINQFLRKRNSKKAFSNSIIVKSNSPKRFSIYSNYNNTKVENSSRNITKNFYTRRKLSECDHKSSLPNIALEKIRQTKAKYSLPYIKMNNQSNNLTNKIRIFNYFSKQTQELKKITRPNSDPYLDKKYNDCNYKRKSSFHLKVHQ